MRIQVESIECPANCHNGQVACPDHTRDDGDVENPFCIECDMPMDEIKPTVNCPDCFEL